MKMQTNGEVTRRDFLATTVVAAVFAPLSLGALEVPGKGGGESPKVAGLNTKSPEFAKIFSGHSEAALYPTAISAIAEIVNDLQGALASVKGGISLRLKAGEATVSLERSKSGDFSSTSNIALPDSINASGKFSESDLYKFRAQRQGFGIEGILTEAQNIAAGKPFSRDPAWKNIFGQYALDQIAARFIEPRGVPW